MRFLKGNLTILILLFVVIVKAQEKTNFNKNVHEQKTIITGIISNPAIAEVKLRFFSDFISFDEDIFDLPIMKDQSFRMSFNLSEAIPTFFQYNGFEIPLYIEPGDSLSIHFDAKDIASSVVFKGKGSIHNTCIRQLAKAFQKWDSDYILYEIAQNEPRPFRRFMDGLHFQKHNYLDNYNPDFRNKFSTDFLQYIYAEVNYWWAYHLMNYRIEHPIANGDPSPMELPKSYYNFLNTILISNDQALNNKYYLSFLDQYVQFRGEEHKSFSDKQIAPDVEVVVPSLVVLEGPDAPPVLEELAQGTKLRSLKEKSDFKSKTLVNDQFREDYWYKIKTAIGTEGWVLGVGIEEVALDTTSLVDEKDDDKNHYTNAEKYLEGKTLLYTKASNLYFKKLYGASLEEIQPSAEEFIKFCSVEQYNELLKLACKIEEADDENPSRISNVYPLIRQPNITTGEPIKEITTIVVNEGTPTTTVPIKEEVIAKIEPSKKSPKTTVKPILPTKPAVEYVSPVRNTTSYVDIDDKPADRPTSTTLVSGKLRMYGGKKISLTLYSDPIQFQESVFDLSLNIGNQFEQAVEIAEPTIGRLSYGNKSVDIYLEPGDKINLQIDAQNFPKSIVFSGKGSEHNNYLKDQAVYAKSIHKDLKKQIEEATERDFQAFMKRSKIEKERFYKTYPKVESFSRGFQNYAKADIEYWYAYNMLNYPWEHPLYHDQQSPMKVSSAYYAFIETTEVSVSDVLPNMNYTYFLSQYFDYLKMDPANSGVDDVLLAERYLHGEALYYFKAKLLAIACRRGKAKEIGPEIKLFIADCPYESFNDVLRLVYNEEKGLIEGADAPDFTLADIDGNTVSLEDFRGKVVYLDFWATWCSPCLTKINNSKQLKNKFKDKDVVFLYVSLDKDKNTWKNYVKAKKIEGVHLATQTANVYQSRIAKLYKVKRLPAYLLIDKAGKIAYNPAERKYPGRMEDQINLLLYSN